MSDSKASSTDRFRTRWNSVVLSPEAKERYHLYRYHAALGANAAASVALVVGGLKQRDPSKTNAGLIRALTQAAWFAKVSEKVTFLKRFEDEKFTLSIAAAGIALRAPQFVRVFQNGSTLSRAMAVMVASAFIMQAARPMERMFRNTCRTVWNSIKGFHPCQTSIAQSLSSGFARAVEGIDHYMYENPVASNVLKQGPKIFMSMNAAGSIASGYLRKDWYSVAAGATYLVGVGIVHVTEKYMRDFKNHSHPDILGSHADASAHDGHMHIDMH